MPLPAILGLPALVTYLTGVISAAIAWIVQRLTFKLAVFLAALTAMGVGLNNFFTVIGGYIGQLVVAAPPELQAAAFFLPTNTNLCISLILASEAAATIYSLTMSLIKLKVDAA